jgi:hypothetical protein
MLIAAHQNIAQIKERALLVLPAVNAIRSLTHLFALLPSACNVPRTANAHLVFATPLCTCADPQLHALLTQRSALALIVLFATLALASNAFPTLIALLLFLRALPLVFALLRS